MSDIAFVSRQPCAALRGLVTRISGYSARSAPSAFLETAELVVPLIFNLGAPWHVGLGGREAERQVTGFTAGLVPGPVRVSCPGDAELVQVDLTPFGAVRLLGGEVMELVERVVEMDAIDPFAGKAEALHDELYDARSWAARFDIVERFLTPRFRHPVRPPVWAAWSHLASGGSVGEAAKHVEWSTRHLSAQFRRETGLRPVTAARMMRFQRARALAASETASGWTDIAAAAGYADQSHLIRDFREFAGITPASWAAQPDVPEARPLM